MKPPSTPPDEPERIAALESYEVLDTSPEAAFDDLTRLAAHILDVPIALVSLIDVDRQWFKSRYGLEAPQTPRDVSFCGHVVADGRRLVVPDAFADERFHDNPLVTGEPRVRFYAGAPLHTAQGHVLGTLCAIDHSKRELADEQLEMLDALARQVMGQLELRRKLIETVRLSAIIEATPDFVAVTDVESRPVYLNRAARRILEIDEAAGLPESAAAWYPGWAAQKLEREGVPAALRNGSWLGESAIVVGGREIPVLQLLLSQPGRDGRPRLLVTHARDMTELKKLDQLKNEFVSTVSHELRTPLTSIRGSLRLLEGGVAGELPAEAEILVERASVNTERLIRLINDILDLEKIESGKFELALASVALRDVAERAASAVEGFAAEAGVSVSLEVPDLEPIEGDADRLVQVAVNLLSNAIKFSPEGGHVRLVAAPVGRGERLRVSVCDEGPGIAPEDRAKLFGKFQQLDSSDTRLKGGTGLGLAISKRIVEEHGGSIGVESEPGAGSTFWFEIPRKP